MRTAGLASALVMTSLVVAPPAPARAEEPEPAQPVQPAQIVTVPSACQQFWSIPGGDSSPAAWDTLISFASCIQDRRTYRVERADELADLVEQLRGALVPSLQLYGTAIEQGPPTIQLRAAYHVGLAQITMMTRARASVASSDLRSALEPLLEPHAELAYFVFTTIAREGASDPALAPDTVSRYMLRSSRELAAALRKRWRTPPGDDEPQLARPELR